MGEVLMLGPLPSPPSGLSACHAVNKKNITFATTLKIIQLCAGDQKQLPQKAQCLLPSQVASRANAIYFVH